uniref:Uncharacterized protein n=1 Tax=Tanacetum cinerariifolium TaxID=118510 RepID=A0A699IWA3_TANCI|nr:hypothetical protein [Tanacetum cinerariifolium]
MSHKLDEMIEFLKSIPKETNKDDFAKHEYHEQQDLVFYIKGFKPQETPEESFRKQEHTDQVNEKDSYELNRKFKIARDGFEILRMSVPRMLARMWRRKRILAKLLEVNSSGSSFWSVESISTSTIPIIEKIDKTEKLIIDGKVTLVDDEGKPLEKVDYLDDHDSEDEVQPDDNRMASFLASKSVGYDTNSLLK